MEIFPTKVNGIYPLNIFAKLLILDICGGLDNVSDFLQKSSSLRRHEITENSSERRKTITEEQDKFVSLIYHLIIIQSKNSEY